MLGITPDQRVTVMGLGRFGGGAGVVRWIVRNGGRVVLTDLASAGTLAEPLAGIADLVDAGAVTLRLGAHRVEDFRETDLVVASPAVPRPWENPYLDAARDAGVPITTEIRLVVERLDRRRVIGVTGTAGKSTTAAMIHHVLTRAGRTAHLGGNIGGSLLGSIDAIGPEDHVVLELSSFQLHWLGAGVGSDDAAGWSPHVGVLTNLAPNHLDWHGTMEHYEASKMNLFAYQVEGDHRITADQFMARRPLPLKIPGAHNQDNGFFAVAAVLRAADILPPESAPLLADFPGLPHRLEVIRETEDGRRFVNDSKSTTPEATVLAVRAFRRPSQVHLIAGGYDKGSDLGAIAALRPRLAGLYTIGATGPALHAAAEDAVDGDLAGAGHLESCETLDRAVAAAMSRMQAGDVLLLSPGCASWDQFENFETRGERFRSLVSS